MTTQPFFNWSERTHLFDRLRWNWNPDDSRQEAVRGRIAIVGLPGVGKKTLCNNIWGWEAIQPSSETVRNFGLFTLIDLPAETYEANSVLYRLENVDLILYMLDATQPLHSDDFAWIARLRGLDSTLLIVANKVDHMNQEQTKAAVRTLEERLSRPILPVAANSANHVRRWFIPALLRHAPEISTALGSELTAFRTRIVFEIILRNAASALVAHLNSDQRDGAGIQLEIQLQMVRRIATLYGRKTGEMQRMELILSPVLRFILKLLLSTFGWLPKRWNGLTKSLIPIIITVIVATGTIAYYQVTGQVATVGLFNRQEKTDHGARQPNG